MFTMLLMALFYQEKLRRESPDMMLKGVKMYETLVDKKIKGTKRIWGKMLKRNLKIFTALNKELKMKNKDHVIKPK